ncbi:protein B4 [Erpetoichthys calabaricus]|uniref:protein B4 n=1 Tax=Erpetoichthys calabaricus TaxID=27687 RepID=UPI002234A6D6|nr:protein B4 [Erpetoichthys calabaricus]
MAAKRSASEEETSTTKTVATVKASRPPSSGHPSTINMVVEALKEMNIKKGVSVVAIRGYILAKYPSVLPARLKPLLKNALLKGLGSGILIRPKNSTAIGATGSFKLGGKEKKRVLNGAKSKENVDPNEKENATRKAPAKKPKSGNKLKSADTKKAKVKSEVAEENQAENPEKAVKAKPKKTKDPAKAASEQELDQKAKPKVKKQNSAEAPTVRAPKKSQNKTKAEPKGSEEEGKENADKPNAENADKPNAKTAGKRSKKPKEQ